ncbi:MAG: hypothetical protein ACRC6I_19340, partial [Paracoccaceae bacterium]
MFVSLPPSNGARFDAEQGPFWVLLSSRAYCRLDGGLTAKKSYSNQAAHYNFISAYPTDGFF